MSDTNIPILIPLDEGHFWEKMREIIRAELDREKKPGAGITDVPGLIRRPIYKVEEVCSLLSVSRQTIHAWVKEGILRAYKVKSRLYFLATEVDELVKAQAK